MKLTYYDIIDLIPGQSPTVSSPLVKLLTASFERGKIPLSKISCDMERALKSAEELAKSFEEARKKIMGAFDSEDEDANKDIVADEVKANWRTDAERLKVFNEEFVALMELEVDLQLTAQPVELIDQARNFEWSGAEQARVRWFFEQAEEAAPSNVESIAEHQAKKEQAA